MSLRCVWAVAIPSRWRWNAEAELAVLVESRYVVEGSDNGTADGAGALQRVASFRLRHDLPDERTEFCVPRIRAKYLPNEDVLPFSQMQWRHGLPVIHHHGAISKRFFFGQPADQDRVGTHRVPGKDGR